MSLSQAYASATADSSTGFGAAFRTLGSTLRSSIEQRRARARSRAELEAYSDRQLKDLGISRSDISSIVDGHYGR